MPTILVTGASGQLGRQIVEALARETPGSLVAGSRTPESLASFRQQGIETRKVDFDAPETLDRAFVGVDRLLVISTDELTTPGLRQKQHFAAIDAAVRAGISHVAYTSMPRPEPGSPVPFAPDHQATETALANSGLATSILRNSWYCENLLATLPYILRSGIWYTSAADGRIPYVTREDTARAAAGALLGTGRTGTFDITGPEAMTVAQMAAIAGEVFGKSIEVVQVSDERLGVELAGQGVATSYVPMAVVTDANQRAGRFDIVSDAVEALSGRKPTTFASFLAEHRDEFLSAGRN